jgi:hypothetical protein
LTLLEAISRIDALKPNTYKQSVKTRWLSDLDGIIKKEIIDVHEGADAVSFEGYDDDTSPSALLLVPAPYDDIYLKWLEASIDYANGEYGKYNNSITMYNTAYSAFANYYNRTHMPICGKFQFF